MHYDDLPDVYLAPLILGFKYIYIYISYECFARVYVCLPHACLVARKAKRGYQILWDWNYRQL